MKKYPRGKLRADDRGALNIKVAIQDNTFLMIFPYPVDWFGLGLAELEGLIGMLQEKAEQLRGSAQ